MLQLDWRNWARGRETWAACAQCPGVPVWWQHPVSTLREGAPSFFLTWPDSFSEEIYTGTDQNICHSKPLWSREMRHWASDLGPHTFFLGGRGALVPGEGTTRGIPWHPTVEGPWATLMQVIDAGIYLAAYRHLEPTGLHPCRLASLSLRSRQRSCHF